MPTIGDIVGFLGGQTFGTTFVPNTDLTGKTVAITGANTGLGFECGKHLARLKVSRLIFGCRDIAKGERAKQAILSEGYDTVIEVWEVDLSSYNSVLAFSDRVQSDQGRLDAFVANAGVEMKSFQTAENLELTLTVNVVSTLLMAIGVLPKLNETATKHGIQTSLTVVGSMIHVFGPTDQLHRIPAGTNILDALSDPKTADMEGRYNLSKLLIHLLVNEVGHSTAHGLGSEVALHLVNPGWCASELGRWKDPALFERVMFSLIGRTAEEGSRTLAHSVVTADEGMHGRYLSECRVKEQSSYVRSDEGRIMARRLFEETITLIRSISPQTVKVFE